MIYHFYSGFHSLPDFFFHFLKEFYDDSYFNFQYSRQIHMRIFFLVYGVSYQMSFFEATLVVIFTRQDLKYFVKPLEYKPFFEFECLVFRNNIPNLKYFLYQLLHFLYHHFLSILPKIIFELKDLH